MMELKLHPAVVSPDDLQLLKLEITGVADSLQGAATAKKETIAQLSPSLRELLGLAEGKLPSIGELEKLQAWLDQIQAHAPVAHLTLPALAADKLRLDLVSWFRDQIHPQTLVVFVYNRGLAGGFALRLGTKIYDFSFRHLLLTNPQAMTKAMKHV